MQTDQDTQRRSRLVAMAGVALAIAGALLVGLPDSPGAEIIAPAQAQPEAPHLSEDTAWLMGALDGLIGQPVTPAQIELLPWPSVSVVVITPDNKEVARRGLAIEGGVWQVASGETVGKVRITEGGVVGLHPYLRTILGGGELSKIGKASASLAMGRLMDSGDLAVGASPSTAPDGTGNAHFGILVGMGVSSHPPKKETKDLYIGSNN